MSDIMQMIAGVPGLIIAMVVHEYAHARVAVAMGDPTPRIMGRLTLNPMRHIDPVGMLCMFLVHFGWAKPVSINPYNFRSPRMGDILVSLAGPFANFVTAFVTMAVLFLSLSIVGTTTRGVTMVLQLIIIYNISFGVFNLIPVPPLDGSHVLKEILPPNFAERLEFLDRYSMFILVAFLLTPLPELILRPMVTGIWTFMSMILSVFL